MKERQSYKPFMEWILKNYEFHGDYYISYKELQDGISYTDLSHFTVEEIEDLYKEYRNGNKTT